MSEPALKAALFHLLGTPLKSLPELVTRTVLCRVLRGSVSFIVTACSLYRSSRAHDATVEGCMSNNKAYTM
jgi:hypothetical protein